jgi:hypothetical protein
MFVVRAAAFIATPLLVSGVAQGQSQTAPEFDAGGAFFRNDVAGKRHQPAFDPPGFVEGSMTLYPKLTLRFNHDSNVFNRSTAVRGDQSLVISPEFRIASNWGRHSYAMTARSDIRRFANINLQNSETYLIDNRGVADLDYGVALIANLSFGKQIEPKGAAGEQVADGSVSSYKLVDIGFGGRAEYGHFRILTGLAIDRREYLPIKLSGAIAPIPQSFRNADQYTLSFRSDYDTGGSVVAFLSAKATKTRSLIRQTCCVRDSVGASGLLGARVELGPNVVAEIGGGYLFRNFAQTQYTDFKGFTYDAKIDWYPTPLISLRASADRGITNSALPSVAGILTNNFSLHAHYELLRNLNISATGVLSRERYREIGLTATSRSIGIDADYALTQNLRAGLSAKYRSRSSSDATLVRSFHGFDLSVSVGFAL